MDEFGLMKCICMYVSARLHGVKSQNNIMLIFTAVRTSNLIYFLLGATEQEVMDELCVSLLTARVIEAFVLAVLYIFVSY
jgi:hypothetical protein